MRRVWEHFQGLWMAAMAGLCVFVQKRGAGYALAVAVDHCDRPDAPPRAQGRQQEFQLQSGF